MPNDTLPTPRPRSGASLRDAASSFSDLYGLTTRERDVLFLLASGIAHVADLADGLALRPNTVHNHLKGIFRRTRTRSKSELLAALLLHALERTDSSARLYRRPQVLLLDACRSFADALCALGMRVHEAASNDPGVAGSARIDAVIAPWCSPTHEQALRTRLEGRIGPGACVLLVAAEGEAAEAAPNELAQVLPPDPHRLAFEILVALCDDPYTRSRLLRIESELPAVLNRCVQTELVNLGFGGAFVALPRERLDPDTSTRPGEAVELSLSLPDAHVVRTRATVIWARPQARVALPSGIGVRFDSVTDADRARIEALVRWKRVEALRASVAALRRGGPTA